MRSPRVFCSRDVREFSVGGHKCAENQEHSAACYWAAFPLMCHGGRRPCCVVAGLVAQGSGSREHTRRFVRRLSAMGTVRGGITLHVYIRDDRGRFDANRLGKGKKEREKCSGVPAP